MILYILTKSLVIYNILVEFGRKVRIKVKQMNIQAVSSYNYNNYNAAMTRAQAPKQNISFSSYQTDYGEPVAELDPELFDFIEKNKKEYGVFRYFTSRIHDVADSVGDEIENPENPDGLKILGRNVWHEVKDRLDTAREQGHVMGKTIGGHVWNYEKLPEKEHMLTDWITGRMSKERFDYKAMNKIIDYMYKDFKGGQGSSTGKYDRTV